MSTIRVCFGEVVDENLAETSDKPVEFDMPEFFSHLTDANRPIRLRLFTVDGVRDDLLLVKHVGGVEAICGGIAYSLLCLSEPVGIGDHWPLVAPKN